MVRRYSKDPQSIPKNGDLGYYERDRVPPAIADVFFRLPVDSISEPMQFNYGFHIFKVTEKKPVPPFENLYKDLKPIYQKVRYQNEYGKYVKNLKSQYHVTIDTQAVNKFISAIDTTKIAGTETWKDTLTGEMLNLQLIRCSGRPLLVKDFAEKISTTDEYNQMF